jgi:hypothetical protein
MGAGSGAAGGGPVISANQAEKNWKNLRDDLKRRESAPYGMQQYGDPQRYHMAGVAPGWYNPALNNQRQLEKLQAVEAQKQQERLNKLNPPVIPPTRGQPISVRSGRLNIAPLVQAIRQNVPTATTTAGTSSNIDEIRRKFIESLL